MKIVRLNTIVDGLRVASHKLTPQQRQSPQYQQHLFELLMGIWARGGADAVNVLASIALRDVDIPGQQIRALLLSRHACSPTDLPDLCSLAVQEPLRTTSPRSISDASALIATLTYFGRAAEVPAALPLLSFATHRPPHRASPLTPPPGAHADGGTDVPRYVPASAPAVLSPRWVRVPTTPPLLHVPRALLPLPRATAPPQMQQPPPPTPAPDATTHTPLTAPVRPPIARGGWLGAISHSQTGHTATSPNPTATATIPQRAAPSWAAGGAQPLPAAAAAAATGGRWAVPAAPAAPAAGAAPPPPTVADRPGTPAAAPWQPGAAADAAATDSAVVAAAPMTGGLTRPAGDSPFDFRPDPQPVACGGAPQRSVGARDVTFVWVQRAPPRSVQPPTTATPTPPTAPSEGLDAALGATSAAPATSAATPATWQPAAAADGRAAGGAACGRWMDVGTAAALADGLLAAAAEAAVCSDAVRAARLVVWGGEVSAAAAQAAMHDPTATGAPTGGVDDGCADASAAASAAMGLMLRMARGCHGAAAVAIVTAHAAAAAPAARTSPYAPSASRSAAEESLGARALRVEARWAADTCARHASWSSVHPLRPRAQPGAGGSAASKAGSGGARMGPRSAQHGKLRPFGFVDAAGAAATRGEGGGEHGGAPHAATDVTPAAVDAFAAQSVRPAALIRAACVHHVAVVVTTALRVAAAAAAPRRAAGTDDAALPSVATVGALRAALVAAAAEAVSCGAGYVTLREIGVAPAADAARILAAATRIQPTAATPHLLVEAARRIQVGDFDVPMVAVGALAGLAPPLHVAAGATAPRHVAAAAAEGTAALAAAIGRTAALARAVAPTSTSTRTACRAAADMSRWARLLLRSAARQLYSIRGGVEGDGGAASVEPRRFVAHLRGRPLGTLGRRRGRRDCTRPRARGLRACARTTQAGVPPPRDALAVLRASAVGVLAAWPLQPDRTVVPRRPTLIGGSPAAATLSSVSDIVRLAAAPHLLRGASPTVWIRAVVTSAADAAAAAGVPLHAEVAAACAHLATAGGWIGAARGLVVAAMRSTLRAPRRGGTSAAQPGAARARGAVSVPLLAAAATVSAAEWLAAAPPPTSALGAAAVAPVDAFIAAAKLSHAPKPRTPWARGGRLSSLGAAALLDAVCGGTDGTAAHPAVAYPPVRWVDECAFCGAPEEGGEIPNDAPAVVMVAAAAATCAMRGVGDALAPLWTPSVTVAAAPNHQPHHGADAAPARLAALSVVLPSEAVRGAVALLAVAAIAAAAAQRNASAARGAPPMGPHARAIVCILAERARWAAGSASADAAETASDDTSARRLTISGTLHPAVATAAAAAPSAILPPAAWGAWGAAVAAAAGFGPQMPPPTHVDGARGHAHQAATLRLGDDATSALCDAIGVTPDDVAAAAAAGPIPTPSAVVLRALHNLPRAARARFAAWMAVSGCGRLAVLPPHVVAAVVAALADAPPDALVGLGPPTSPAGGTRGTHVGDAYGCVVVAATGPAVAAAAVADTGTAAAAAAAVTADALGVADLVAGSPHGGGAAAQTYQDDGDADAALRAAYGDDDGAYCHSDSLYRPPVSQFALASLPAARVVGGPSSMPAVTAARSITGANAVGPPTGADALMFNAPTATDTNVLRVCVAALSCVTHGAMDGHAGGVAAGPLALWVSERVRAVRSMRPGALLAVALATCTVRPAVDRSSGDSGAGMWVRLLALSAGRAPPPPVAQQPAMQATARQGPGDNSPWAQSSAQLIGVRRGTPVDPQAQAQHQQQLQQESQQHGQLVAQHMPQSPTTRPVAHDMPPPPPSSALPATTVPLSVAMAGICFAETTAGALHDPLPAPHHAPSQQTCVPAVSTAAVPLLPVAEGPTPPAVAVVVAAVAAAHTVKPSGVPAVAEAQRALASAVPAAVAAALARTAATLTVAAAVADVQDACGGALPCAAVVAAGAAHVASQCDEQGVFLAQLPQRPACGGATLAAAVAQWAATPVAAADGAFVSGWAACARALPLRIASAAGGTCATARRGHAANNVSAAVIAADAVTGAIRCADGDVALSECGDMSVHLRASEATRAALVCAAQRLVLSVARARAALPQGVPVVSGSGHAPWWARDSCGTVGGLLAYASTAVYDAAVGAAPTPRGSTRRPRSAREFMSAAVGYVPGATTRAPARMHTLTLACGSDDVARAVTRYAGALTAHVADIGRFVAAACGHIFGALVRAALRAASAGEPCVHAAVRAVMVATLPPGADGAAASPIASVLPMWGRVAPSARAPHAGPTAAPVDGAAALREWAACVAALAAGLADPHSSHGPGAPTGQRPLWGAAVCGDGTLCDVSDMVPQRGPAAVAAPWVVAVLGSLGRCAVPAVDLPPSALAALLARAGDARPALEPLLRTLYHSHGGAGGAVGDSFELVSTEVVDSPLLRVPSIVPTGPDAAQSGRPFEARLVLCKAASEAPHPRNVAHVAATRAAVLPANAAAAPTMLAAAAATTARHALLGTRAARVPPLAACMVLATAITQGRIVCDDSFCDAAAVRAARQLDLSPPAALYEGFPSAVRAVHLALTIAAVASGVAAPLSTSAAHVRVPGLEPPAAAAVVTVSTAATAAPPEAVAALAAAAARVVGGAGGSSVDALLDGSITGAAAAWLTVSSSTAVNGMSAPPHGGLFRVAATATGGDVCSIDTPPMAGEDRLTASQLLVATAAVAHATVTAAGGCARSGAAAVVRDALAAVRDRRGEAAYASACTAVANAPLQRSGGAAMLHPAPPPPPPPPGLQPHETPAAPAPAPLHGLTTPDDVATVAALLEGSVTVPSAIASEVVRWTAALAGALARVVCTADQSHATAGVGDDELAETLAPLDAAGGDAAGVALPAVRTASTALLERIRLSDPMVQAALVMAADVAVALQWPQGAALVASVAASAVGSVPRSVAMAVSRALAATRAGAVHVVTGAVGVPVSLADMTAAADGKTAPPANVPALHVPLAVGRAVDAFALPRGTVVALPVAVTDDGAMDHADHTAPPNPRAALEHRLLPLPATVPVSVVTHASLGAASRAVAAALAHGAAPVAAARAMRVAGGAGPLHPLPPTDSSEPSRDAPAPVHTAVRAATGRPRAILSLLCRVPAGFDAPADPPTATPAGTAAGVPRTIAATVASIYGGIGHHATLAGALAVAPLAPLRWGAVVCNQPTALDATDAAWAVCDTASMLTATLAHAELVAAASVAFQRSLRAAPTATLAVPLAPPRAPRARSVASTPTAVIAPGAQRARDAIAAALATHSPPSLPAAPLPAAPHTHHVPSALTIATAAAQLAAPNGPASETVPVVTSEATTRHSELSAAAAALSNATTDSAAAAYGSLLSRTELRAPGAAGGDEAATADLPRLCVPVMIHAPTRTVAKRITACGESPSSPTFDVSASSFFALSHAGVADVTTHRAASRNAVHTAAAGVIAASQRAHGIPQSPLTLSQMALKAPSDERHATPRSYLPSPREVSPCTARARTEAVLSSPDIAAVSLAVDRFFARIPAHPPADTLRSVSAVSATTLSFLELVWAGRYRSVPPTEALLAVAAAWPAAIAVLERYPRRRRLLAADDGVSAAGVPLLAGTVRTAALAAQHLGAQLPTAGASHGTPPSAGEILRSLHMVHTKDDLPPECELGRALFGSPRRGGGA